MATNPPPSKKAPASKPSLPPQRGAGPPPAAGPPMHAGPALPPAPQLGGSPMGLAGLGGLGLGGAASAPPAGAYGGPPPGPPAPKGLPVGGSMPGPDDTMPPDSPLLAALASALTAGHDGMIPGGDVNLQGLGPQDPNGGLEQLLSMLAISKAGVAGGPPFGVPAGGSGVDTQNNDIGTMLGF